MHPVLFYIGDLSIHTYGLMMGMGIFLAAWGAARLGQKDGVPLDWLWDLALLITFGAVIGSRLEYVRTHWVNFAANPIKILAIRDGGLVFYGGFVFTLLLMVGYIRWRRLSTLRILDIYAVYLPFGHAIGRIGCFAAGCCYGRPTDLPWGVRFPEGTAAPADIPLHPTQLYEVAYNTLLYVGLYRFYQYKRQNGLPDGQVFAALLIAYGSLRFINEFFRGDQERGFVIAGLSNAQVTAIILMIFGYIVLWFRRASPQRA